MKFVGRPQGKLMKGAPGNYVQNQIYRIPFRHSKFKFWQLVEETPELVVPEMMLEDSVYESAPEEVVVEKTPFEEPIFVPEPEVETIEEEEDEKAETAESPATVTYRGRQLFTEDVSTSSTQDDEVTVSELELESEPDTSVTLEVLEASTMAQLRAFIKSQGADPNPTGKKGYISRAELLEVARSLLPDES